MPDELIIRTIADFERVLDENPPIRERIRGKLLTDEERELPRVIENLLEQVSRLTLAVTDGFAQASEDLVGIRQGMSQGFAEAAADRVPIREHVKGIQTSMKSLEVGQESMVSLLLEQTAARRLLPRIAQDVGLSRPTALKSLDQSLSEEVEDALYQAVAQGDISVEQADAATASDFIMSGISDGPHRRIYVLVEVSATLNRHQISRAKDRAAVLEKVLGDRVIPAVAAVTIPAAQRHHATNEKVLLYLLENPW